MKVRELIKTLLDACELEDEVMVMQAYSEYPYANPEYQKARGIEFVREEKGKIIGVVLY